MSVVILAGEVQRKHALDLIAALDLSKAWEVEVRPQRKKRSLDQNALFHAWVKIIADKVGDDAESVKYDLKCMFLGRVEHVSAMTGEVTMRPPSTTTLTTVEMAAFCDKIMAFAASQLGIRLPTRQDLHDYSR